MSEIKVNQEFQASADTVWKELADFGGIGEWAPGLETCTVEGEGVGAVRALGMAGGIAMKERLESIDNGARRLSYSIVEGPMPVQNYLATIQVSQVGDGCRVDWSATFDVPDGVPAEALGKGVSGAYSGMLTALKQKLREA
jgi:carbon monoxide dehydrogenase subunit G